MPIPVTRSRMHYDVETDGFVIETCDPNAIAVLRQPLSVGCLVTGRCNMECPHCYGDAESLPGAMLPVAQWAETFRNLHTLGVRRVDISGGEPTLRSDLAEIIAAARDSGMAVVLSTNGSRSPAFLIDRIPRDVRIHVSVDGSTAAIHESNRLRHDGKPYAGSFEAVRTFMRELIAAGYRVRALTAVGPNNATDVAAIAESLALLGVTDWNVSLVLRAGRANDTQGASWTVDATDVLHQVECARAAYPDMRIGFSDRTDQNGYFLLVLPDGSLATQFTDGTDKHVLGASATMTLRDLLGHPDFDAAAHASKWIHSVVACQSIDCPHDSEVAPETGRSSAAAWIDERTAAIANLQGRLIVAREENGAPDLWQVVGGADAIEMVTTINDRRIVTSYGAGALAVWTPDGANVLIESTTEYPNRWGAATCGLYLRQESVLVSGHAAGVVAFWQCGSEAPRLDGFVDVRSATPVGGRTARFEVRGLARWRDSVITAAEDGDLCLLNHDSRRITLRKRYNVAALRGINSISVAADRLLLGNCAVGRSDANLWLFGIRSDAIHLLDAKHLIASESRSQAFGFSVQLVESDSLRFFASTEEGLVWTGRVEDDRLVVTGAHKLEEEGGLVLAPNANGRVLLAAGRDLHLLDIRCSESSLSAE